MHAVLPEHCLEFQFELWLECVKAELWQHLEFALQLKDLRSTALQFPGHKFRSQSYALLCVDKFPSLRMQHMFMQP